MAQDIVSKAKTVTSPDVYSDLDLFFTAHPITGDVSRKFDSDAIKRSVKNIVLTNYYERPFKPSLGGGIRNLLFDLDTDVKLSRAQKQLRNTIQMLEPRIERVACGFFKTDDNAMQVVIHYKIRNGMPNQEVEFTVRRTR